MSFSTYSGRPVVTCTAAQAPWQETFEGYADGELVQSSVGRNLATHVAVTSGALYAKQVVGKPARVGLGTVRTYIRGQVMKPANAGFRAVAVKDLPAGRVAWTDGGSRFRF